MLAFGSALAAGVLAAVALGQEGGPIQMTATFKVTPDKAGTPSHPRGIQIEARGKVYAPAEAAMPVVRSFDVWLPKGWVYNGAKHPTCTLATLNLSGPSNCPPESIMSRGLGAHADVVDDLNPPPRVTIVNGGRTKMYFWTVLSNPARVQAAVPGSITKVNSPRWSYRLHADIPSSLQVVAGIPITLTSFHTKVGRGDWLATISCPRDRLWRHKLRITSTSGQVLDTSGSVACRN